MSTLKDLKEYLVGNGGYLLNDDNNGKTVMLSGAWGSGKTHFWLEDIKPQLLDKKQKNIYISLYGKESIGELKFEVLREAYNLEVKEDFISKTASMISSIAPSLGEKSLVDGFDKLNKQAKDKKAKEILQSGSIVCLDDFERKSKNIDLNDLFGYISQLALDYHCKVVIILNSDVFEGEEANVFKTVKEKTVNKFFYFEPTIEELFNSIYESNEKYKALDDYNEEILKAIEETEELNARIYIQVLDNCLEWIEKAYCSDALRTLVLSNINFIINHTVLYMSDSHYVDRQPEHRQLIYLNSELYIKPVFDYFRSRHYYYLYDENKRLREIQNLTETQLFHDIKKFIESKDQREKFYYPESSHAQILDWIERHEKELCILWKYGYRLNYVYSVDKNIYSQIVEFIRTGILPKKDKELSS